MSNLYGRVVELYVNNKIFYGDEFDIEFEVPFDTEESDDVAEITIYNLSDKTINAFGNKPKIILNAGYTGDVGAILLGLTQNKDTEWDDVDKATTLLVADGADSYYSTPIKKTYAKGMKASQIIKDISSFTGIKLGYIKLPTDKVYTKGKTVKGKLSQVLAKIASECGAKGYVRRGQMYIRPKTDGKTIGYVIDEDHGLIGSPTPIEREVTINEDTGATKTYKGWKVKTLLNHRITAQSVVEIHSKTANGIFLVENGRHYSNGNDFLTEMECYAP